MPANLRAHPGGTSGISHDVDSRTIMWTWIIRHSATTLRAVERASEAVGRVEAVARRALTDLLALAGVHRVGLALSEGGGRRLRFTASDRDHSRAVDWCHIDAYDDVPLTAVLRSGVPVVSTLEHLDERYASFAAHQRALGRSAVAAVPLPGTASPIGAVILFYASAQAFTGLDRAALDDAAAGLARDLRAAQAVTPRDVPLLADEPVTEGSEVADAEFDGDPGKVGSVRRWARASLAGWGLDADRIDDAVLCLSELVTNALMHTRSACEVRLVLSSPELTVTVRDRGAAAHALDHGHPQRDPLSVHGRGLQIVDALSARWGSAQDASGTTVWFALSTAAGSSGA